MTKKSLWVVFVLFMLFLSGMTFNMGPASTHSGVVLSAWASRPPTIDGTIDVAEWADAASSSYTTTGGISGTFYVMNDAVNLYIAVNTTDSTLSNDTTGTDRVFVYFDNDNDTLGPEAGDDIIGWNGYLGEGFRDGFSDGTYACYKDSDDGGTTDGRVGATNDGTYNYFEILHPLNTIDDAHDFSLRLGETVGFALRLTVDGGDGGWWPSSDLSLWHDIVIAEGPPPESVENPASKTPTIDGIIGERVVLRLPGHPGMPEQRREVILSGEWDDAARVDFTLTYESEVHEATLYIKNDYINLYLALEVRDEDYHDLDTILLSFDNDNDSVREIGDNVLYLRGDNYFDDLYIYDAGAGWSQSDASDGGTIDGVGAAYFTAEGNWNFEVAFPLNTSDDAHDFNLSVGAAVGFNLEFFDFMVGSDVWPSPLWSEMASIQIAAPPTTPPPSAADLNITGIEVTQAIQSLDNSMPLVRGKTTVVRVYVDTGPVPPPPYAIDVKVFLFGLDQSSRSLGALSDSFSAPRLSLPALRGKSTYTANFLLPMDWIDRDCLVLKSFVKAYWADQAETDYDNNWMVGDGLPELRLRLGRTRTLNINIVPICTPDPPTDQAILEQEEYLRAIYPVADVNFILHRPYEWTGGGKRHLILHLNTLAGTLGISHPDQIYGVVPPGGVGGGISDPLWEGGLGVASCGESCPDSRCLPWMMTHEITHNLGPGQDGRGWGRHTGEDADWPYPNDNINEYGATAVWGWPPQIIQHTMVEVMKARASSHFESPHRWISPYRWEKMFVNFSSSSTAGHMMVKASTNNMTECLQISGWVSQNGTGSLDPIFRLRALPLQPKLEGNCSIELQDVGGGTLLTKRFAPVFVDPCEGTEQDTCHFAMFLPYQNGTGRVVLKWGGEAIDTMQMSQYEPCVEVLSPNGGEVWEPSIQTIEWVANDSDGDPLVYRLYYSADNGATWTPLSPTINETSYEINASYIKGGNTSLIRVVASDGFNIGQDQTDTVFTVMDKPPTAKILQPQNGSQFHMEDVMLLRGKGNDADDVILPPTAYNWTSDLDGYLGNGTTLTRMLTPGTHQVTLTVTDSQGNTATDTIIITVTVDIEITSVTPSKNVVGQGLSMDINVAVENRAPITQTFNTTIYANTTVIDTRVNITLPSGNSTTLTIPWNTTGTAKGNYTIKATATPLPGETDLADNTLTDGWVMVATPGDFDVDGDVDIDDVRYFCEAYIKYWTAPVGKKDWEPPAGPDPDQLICDLDNDCDIDIDDIRTFCSAYIEYWTP